MTVKSPTNRHPGLQDLHEPVTSPRSATDYRVIEDDEEIGCCRGCCCPKSFREETTVDVPSPIPVVYEVTKDLKGRVSRRDVSEFGEALAMHVSPRSAEQERQAGALPPPSTPLSAMAIISPGREALLAENYNKLQAHIQTRGYLPPLPSARGSGPILTLEEQAVYNRNHPRLKEAEAKDYLEKEKVAAKSYRHRPLGFKYKETNLIDGMHNKHFEVPGFEAGIGTLTNDMYKQKTFGLRGPKTIKIAGKIAGQDTPLTYFMVLESHQGSDALEFIGHEFLPTGKMFATELEIQLRAENAGGISEAGILNALNLTCASLNDQLNGSIEDHRSGCVMGMALFLLDRIWFVNMGHTRMIWVNCETGETTQMTEDAVASLPRDLEEIQARHGRVVQNDGRYCINGVVPTSRAFGYPKERGVIPLPKITYLSLSEIPPNSFVLLGTSHLWKMGTPEEIGQAIIDHKDLPTWQLATHLTGSANGWHELLHRHSTTDILPKSRIPEMTLILVKIKPDEIRPFQMPIYRLPSGDPSDGPD